MSIAPEPDASDRSSRGILRRAPRRRDRLAPDAPVVFAAERKAVEMDEVLDALDLELVGLAPVKKQVREIAALLLVDQVRARFGPEAPRPSLHMCFTGSPDAEDIVLDEPEDVGASAA